MVALFGFVHAIAFVLSGLLCFVNYEFVWPGQLLTIFSFIFIMDSLKIESMRGVSLYVTGMIRRLSPM